METIQANLYDYPQYYDLVFGSDWRAEYGFLWECFEAHVDHKVRRVFEPACGTGRLLYRFGLDGLQVGGNDLNAKAIEYCNKRLRRHGLPETAVVGDMTDFELKQPVDAAFNTINSFRHLRTHSLAAAHLDCMTRALRPGGIYVLGLHLTPTAGSPMDSESWSARRGHLCVNTDMRTTSCDLVSREERFRMTYDVYTPTNSFRLEDEIVFRTYTAAQFQELIDDCDGLDIVAAYDFAYDIDAPLEIGDRTEDVVYVLRRER